MREWDDEFDPVEVTVFHLVSFMYSEDASYEHLIGSHPLFRLPSAITFMDIQGDHAGPWPRAQGESNVKLFRNEERSA